MGLQIFFEKCVNHLNFTRNIWRDSLTKFPGSGDTTAEPPIIDNLDNISYLIHWYKKLKKLTQKLHDLS